MINREEINQKYIIGYSNQINKVTKPLKEHFGISFFGYHRIDIDGKYTVLCNRPDWAEHYLEKGLYINDPYLKHPHEYSSGVCFFSSLGSQEKAAMIGQWRKKIQADEGLVLIEKNSDAVEFFIFAGDYQESSNFSKLFLNHLPLLRTFSCYFKNEMEFILYKQKQEGYTLSVSKNTGPISDPKIEKEKKKKFLISIGLQREWELVDKLTKREQQCLKLISEGKSTKGVASALSISSRTVESYLINAKDKLGCWYKEDLAAKATVFQNLDLL